MDNALMMHALSAEQAARHPLMEPMCFYDPPYEDPLDDRLAWQLVHALAPGCALQYRTVALTPDDCFRVDFLIEQHVPRYGVRRIALFTGRGDEDAPMRDALVVGAGAADVLYRFRKQDLDRHLPDALLLMAKWSPSLFGADRRTQLAQRASPDARHYRVWPGQAEVRLAYPPGSVEVGPGIVPERPAPPSELVVRRLSRRHPATWQQAYRAARSAFTAPGRSHRRMRWARSA